MRVGNNPLRGKNIDSFPPIIISVITHLPHQGGYHAKRLQVVKLCLLSMREACGMDNVKVMVWDNGSCDELLRWLHYDYRPDYIMTSPNVGKINARTAMLKMLPENTILAMCDDDMYFYQDWLKESVKLLRVFPRVGVVSGYPVRANFRWATIKSIEWARKCEDAELEIGRFIPDRWEDDYAISLGRDIDFHRTYMMNDMDYRVTYTKYDKKYQAFLTAHHCQWLGYAGRLSKLMKYDYQAMADDKPFDNSIDNAGLLRLATTQRYVRHIGNVLDDDIKDHAHVMGYM